MKVAIYPGTFDPITKGHLDIIIRSIKFVDKLIIAVSKDNKKNTLFKINERIELVTKVIQDEKISNVEVDSFEGLLMKYANKKRSEVERIGYICTLPHISKQKSRWLSEHYKLEQTL